MSLHGRATLSATLGALDSAATLGALVDLEDVVRFQTAGWIHLRQLLPELAQTGIMDDVRISTRQTNARYVNHSLAFLKRAYKVRCNDPPIVSECGAINPEACTVDDGETATFEGLRCCVRAGNRELRALGEARVQANTRRLAAQGYSNVDGSTVTLPYYQNLNLHHHSDRLRQIATSSHLGRAAATLLQTKAVRLYQTALFVKSEEAQNAATGWHQDLVLVPLDAMSGGFLTFWCPLERPLDAQRDSVLQFAEGSHRDQNLLYWYANPVKVDGLLAARYPLRSAPHLELGDCTAHHGWTHHRAPAQHKDAPPRSALSFSYFSSEAMRLPDLMNTRGVRNRADRVFQFEDELSWADWYGEVKDFVPVDHPLLPLVFDGQGQGAQQQDHVETLSRDFAELKVSGIRG